jgi:hypothetical protein
MPVTRRSVSRPRRPPPPGKPVRELAAKRWRAAPEPAGAGTFGSNNETQQEFSVNS